MITSSKSAISFLKTFQKRSRIISNSKGVSEEYAESTKKKYLEKLSIGDSLTYNLKSPADFVACLTSEEEVAAYYNAGTRKKDEKVRERVVQIRRVTKVVKGGKQISFRAVVVIGDENGQVGTGVATAKEVIGAVSKAVTDAKKNMINVPLTRTKSIPHRIESRVGASRVILRPASEGTGVVAGGATRVVLELAGLRNVFGKQLGADSPLNNSRATIAGLKELRTFSQVAKDRGITLDQFLGKNLSK